MASNQTPNLQLSQWEADDEVLRADFNADNAKIDAAVGELRGGQLRLVSGTYKGTETYGADSPTILEVADAERPPQLVIVSESEGFYRAVLVRGMTRYAVSTANNNSHFINLIWTDKGVRWYSTEASHTQLNSRTSNYYYTIII